jgi:hypothetical protein
MEMMGEDCVSSGRREMAKRESEPSAAAKKEASACKEREGFDGSMKEHSFVLMPKEAWLYIPVQMLITF